MDEGAAEIDPDRFEELVSAALDTIPAELSALIDNCVVLVEDDAPAEDPDLLGLYDGTPLTERDSTYSMVTPDRITLFRRPILALCTDPNGVVDPAEVVREVRITVVHEVAHHFGIDDDRLHELGYS